MLPVRRDFPTAVEFEAAWQKPPTPGPSIEEPVLEVARRVADGLAREGFRLFHNGGLPLLDRRQGELRAEIVFAARPHAQEFAVRFHLTHDGVAAVRARFWQPSIRAPKTVATGDVGLLESDPVFTLWSAADPALAAEALLRLVLDRVLPWFDLIDDPPRLRAALIDGAVPMIDLTTAVELMLAEFGVREARRFIRSVAELAWPPLVVPKPEGFALDESRMASVVAYYQL